MSLLISLSKFLPIELFTWKKLHRESKKWKYYTKKAKSECHKFIYLFLENTIVSFKNDPKNDNSPISKKMLKLECKYFWWKKTNQWESIIKRGKKKGHTSSPRLAIIIKLIIVCSNLFNCCPPSLHHLSLSLEMSYQRKRVKLGPINLYKAREHTR